MLFTCKFCFFRLNNFSKRYISLKSGLYFKCLGGELKNANDKRNIGIIAHIDAGKTTVTERLLFLTGLTDTIGDVDDGNTITDFMDLERERGITIQSAAITSMWRNNRINIIDTPGHVDFTFEVERCLRVMDGTVTILDSSAGVQAQTLTVWRQASKFNLPSVFFANKMDKPTSDFDRCIDSVENRLGSPVLPIVVPILKDNNLVGLLNIIDKTMLNLKKIKNNWVSIEKNSEYENLYNKNWENFLSKFGEYDEDFEKVLLSSENVSVSDVKNALRKSVLNLKIFPIACGTALKNIQSVKPLLDMIVDYLPAPNDRNYLISNKIDLCALVFKVGHDEHHGQINYARIYKGNLTEKQTLVNVNQNKKERNFNLFIPYSDILQPSGDGVDAGDIVVITGLKNTVTGDTLCHGLALNKISNIEAKNYVLEGIQTQDPVFLCSIEPPSNVLNNKFERALSELVIEDPSIRIRKDQETSQTILEGMGELHIEVIKERLNREYGLNVFMSSLRVGYREILKNDIVHSSFVEETFGEAKKKQWCSLRLKFDRTKRITKFEKILIDIENDEETSFVRNNWIDAINEGCRVALFNGPLLSFPVSNLIITLRSITTSESRINTALIAACASRCVKEALKLAETCLIEPTMDIELTLMADARGKLYTDSILRELTRRRASIEKIDEEVNGQLVVIYAKMPLSESKGIANRMRELSSGLCSLHMEVKDYELVLPEEQDVIVNRYLHGEH